MRKNNLSMGNRILSLLLSIILVLGMLPVGAITAEEPETPMGSIQGITPGGAVNGNSIYYSSLTLDWVDADEKLGALLHRFAVEIDCSELCHDVMNV